MMCFVCKCCVENLKSLIIHFKIMHSLNTSSTFKCCEDDCSQLFQNLNSFKKHVNTKHILSINNVPTNQIESDINTVFNSNHLSDHTCTNEALTNNTSQSQPNCQPIHFDLVTAIFLFYKSSVEFSLILHNNNSFTRKDVTNIQKNITEKIIKPITVILENIIKTNIRVPMLMLKFNRVTSIMSDPFKLCSSEYLLNKWLIENDFATSIEQFVIHNEVGIVRQLGDVVYDEKITKGVLLPLKFHFRTYFEQNDNLEKSLKQINELNKSCDVCCTLFKENYGDRKY